MYRDTFSLLRFVPIIAFYSISIVSNILSLSDVFNSLKIRFSPRGGYHKVQSTVTFAISFQNCLSVVASLARGDEEAAQTYEYTSTNFYLFQRYRDRYAHYIAIGYYPRGI